MTFLISLLVWFFFFAFFFFNAVFVLNCRLKQAGLASAVEKLIIQRVHCLFLFLRCYSSHSQRMVSTDIKVLISQYFNITF